MNEQKNKLSRSDIASFLAVILSIAALVIGIVETRIMADQQSTMVEQQKASVWPYIEVRSGIQLTDSLVFSSVAENKGVGPALVKNTSISINETSYNEFKEFSLALDSILGENSYTIRRFGITQKTKAVYKPGEQRTLFEIVIFNKEAFLKGAQFFNVSLVYCSIFDDCWGENGQELPAGYAQKEKANP